MYLVSGTQAEIIALCIELEQLRHRQQREEAETKELKATMERLREHYYPGNPVFRAEPAKDVDRSTDRAG